METDHIRKNRLLFTDSCVIAPPRHFYFFYLWSTFPELRFLLSFITEYFRARQKILANSTVRNHMCEEKLYLTSEQ